VWQTMVAHRDRAGELKLLTSILRDLREQKGVESRLRESEAALRALNLELEARVVERTHRLELLNRELEAFFAAIAHDLDEPLLSIDGGGRSVLEEFGAKLPERARNLIQELTHSALRMRTLIRGLLTHSRTLQRDTPPQNL